MQSTSSKILLALFIVLVLGAGAFCLRQQARLVSGTDILQEEVTSLQAQVTQLHTENESLKTSAIDIKLPVVAYGREGVFNTPEGEIEKKMLEEKLVNPYIDYHEDADMNLVSLYIIVPQNIGQAYDVMAIYGGGGTESFYFGKMQEDYDYWAPECMGPCSYSEAFKAKYPQIVEE